MKLIESILPGLAAIVVATAGAQAAELPNGKAAVPAAGRARACNVNGQPGFILPGSDTCVKISGSVEVEVGASTAQGVKRTTP